MAILGASFRIDVPAEAGPQLLFDIRTGASRAALRSIEFTSDISTVNQTFVFGVGRNATAGVARQNDISFVSEDGQSPITNLSIGVDWTTTPTVPTSYLRRISQRLNTAGPTFLPFYFDKFILDASSSFGFWIISGSNLVDFTQQYTVASVSVDY